MLTIQSHQIARFPKTSHTFSPRTLHFGAQLVERFEKTSTRFETELQKHYSGSITELIKHSVQEKNFIDQGASSSVYRIPQMPEFVLRFRKKLDIEKLPPNLAPTAWKPMPINVGRAIISYHDDDIQIVPYQSGKTSKLSLLSFFSKYTHRQLFDVDEQKPLSAIEVVDKRPLYANHLEYVATMPQEAYDDFARKLKVLGRFPDVFFDPYIRNVLADKNNKTFNIVDLGDKNGLGPYKNVAGMAGALIDSLFVNLDETAIDEHGRKLTDNVAEDKSLTTIRHAILEKTFLAAYRTGLDVPEVDWPDIPLENQKTNGKKRYYMDTNYICRVSGFDWQKVKNLLRMAKPDNFSEEAFLQLLKECTLPRL